MQIDKKRKEDRNWLKGIFLPPWIKAMVLLVQYTKYLCEIPSMIYGHKTFSVQSYKEFRIQT